MKWEEKRYTPQELQRMQQEAVERVRQMQRPLRAGHPPLAARALLLCPGFPSEGDAAAASARAAAAGAGTTATAHSFSCAAAGAKATAATSIPGTAFCQRVWSFPSRAGQSGFSLEQVLDSLHLDHDRLLILALFFLLAGEKSDNGLMLALLYLFL